jgi:hypothetical protein
MNYCLIFVLEASIFAKTFMALPTIHLPLMYTILPTGLTIAGRL